MSKTLSGTSPKQARNLDVVKGAPSLGEQNMNKNEQMIRGQAYELWDHGQAGRPKRRILVRCESRIRTRGGDRGGNLGAHVHPARGAVSSRTER
jgi:hypothetical protein